MTEYEFLPEAEEEMNEAARFYERRKEGLGLEFLNEVQRTITSILAHPQSGPTLSQNIRRRIVRRFPFGVLYAIDDEKRKKERTIVIVAVAHLKRRPGYWKERIGKDV
jgi:plasmid stabilization system protein ParE